MTALRWILGSIIGFCSAVVIILFVVADGFRRSFGASENNPLIVFLPLAAMAVLLVGLIFPKQTLLLHIGAVCAVLLSGFCVYYLYTEAATILWFGLLVLAAWFFFYWRALAQPNT